MKVYRIKDWAKHYENNRTKGMKFMQWIPVPVKHDGDGYIQLVSGMNGAEMLGAWLGALQVAAKCGQRGTLLRSSGKPHNAASISAITRLPVGSIEKMLERCCSPDVGWIEVVEMPDVTDCPQSSGSLPAPTTHGTDEETTEGREGADAPAPQSPPPPTVGYELPRYQMSDVAKVLAAYPLKTELRRAEDAVRRAIVDLQQRGESDPVGALIAKCKRYTDSDAGKGMVQHHPKKALYWFSDGNYLDDESTWAAKKTKQPKPPKQYPPGFEPKPITDEVRAVIASVGGGK